MKLICDPRDLKPETSWRETVWAWRGEEELIDHKRKARLCSAVLLPFQNKQPDWQSFFDSLQWMLEAAEFYNVEFVPVLNADTGYIFELEDPMYAEVLKRFRAAFPNQRFIAGITARGAEKDSAFDAERYRPLLDIVQQHENCEVMIMTSRWLNSLDPERRRD
ncbi:MAG: hypothetical protein KGQ60_19425, partial [Planctomycetes bacterium]|nr:hypothetical protein [Planctomycetota bacterium]